MSLYWCVDLNIPALRPRGDGCGYIEVKLTQPQDPRPAFSVDLETLREALVNEFGDERLKSLIPGDEVVLLNKIPGYADQADEVVVRGRVVGHRFYDMLERRWRFRPLYEGVATMLAERLGYWAVVDMSELPPGYDIRQDKVVEGKLPTERYRHVALSTRGGKTHGVAKLFRGGRLHVVKSWRARRPLPPGRPSTLEEMALFNRDQIEKKAMEAVRFLRDVVERHKKPVVVSYSGGKDSLVALDLTARAGVSFYIYFNDTGLEPPETYENLKEVERRYKAEVIVGSAGDAFWRGVERFGLPARDYRWCCKVVKLGPTTRVLKERFPQGYISVVGQRGAESFLRAKLPRVSQSRWVAGSLVAAPIQEWTALEVWLYIYLHRLPYNPAYVRGFDRLGCVICPANEMAELAAVEKNYPKIFERIEKAARREMSRVDWELGLWRWRKKTPGDVVKWTKKSREGRLPARLTKTQEGLQVELDVEPHLETFREFLKMLKPAVEIRQVGGRWLVNTGDERLALDAAGLLVRAAICGDCDLCVYWCPTGALKRVGPGRSFRVDAERCVGCLLCSSVCPSAQYLVYRNEA